MDSPRPPPRALGLRRFGWAVLAGPLLLASARADDPPKPLPVIYNPPRDFGAPPETTVAGTRYRDEQALSNLLPPHDVGAPVVTESGSVRGAEPSDRRLPEVLVLAPPRLARTLSAQPTLYWYLSGPSSAPVRLTLQELDETAPLLEVNLGQVPAKGVYAIALAEHGIRLAPGRLYQWSVALEVNPGSYAAEPVASTILRAGAADPALHARLAGAPPLARVRALAANGYWYDALDLLAMPGTAGEPLRRELWATLLEQAGLAEVAAFERASARAQ